MLARRILTTVTAATASVGIAVALAGPASADTYGSSSENSLNLQAVDVVVTGGAGDPLTRGGTTSISVSVPPKCWWAPFNNANLDYEDIDASDPKAMQKWFRALVEGTTITFVPSRLSHPSADYIKSHLGKDWTWYTLESQPGVNCIQEGFAQKGGTGPEGWGDVAISYAAFETGTPPPPPVVDVQDVVTAVWDRAAAEVLGPDLDRNPQIDTAGGSTLVNLATWFWVQNVEEALAGDGEVRLDVSIPGSPVQATLTSTTDTVQITSAAGAVACSVDAAQVEWSPGASETSACTLPFDRANRAGWPVTAQTTWTGTWQGTDRNGPAGGTLDTLTPSATIQVPVAESEALVNDVD